jgi:hypothetical protein
MEVAVGRLQERNIEEAKLDTGKQKTTLFRMALFV